MNRKQLISLSSLVLASLSQVSHGQALLKEDFTGTTTINNWYSLGGACLTASAAAQGAQPGTIPGCVGIQSTYAPYSENLTGGINGNSGTNQTLPDPSGQGALRFTNGYPGGYNQAGAIISALPYTTGNGLNITFATITYRGNTGGNGGVGNNTTVGSPGYGLPISANDGADGISFFLLNGNTTPTAVGSYGGSLGYSCSNSNSNAPGYTGIPAAFLGLGIDEYGNFLNPGDNTASGPGLQANRIGMRGAGDINFASLSTNLATSAYYPARLATITGVTLPSGRTNATAAEYAVYDTCHTGKIWDYSRVTSAANLAINKVQTSTAIQDYAAIPNGYTVLSGVKIADEYSTGGYARNSTGVAPIYYRLKITPTGLLSLQYSYNGGAYTYVLQNQSLAAVSGTLPTSLYFGFAGSTGGSTNIHEILCFQAAPNTESSSSTTANQRQAAQLNTTTQAYFAYYNPNIWTGRLTANSLVMSGGNLTVATVPSWDASCVLTGATATQCATGQATTAQAPANRQILTWNGSQGVGFEAGSLSPAEQAALTTGDSSNGVASAACAPNCRLNFLRGDRSQEINSSGVGLFRDREDVLADIIDSSPTWVGPPNASYPTTWHDRAHASSSLSNPYPENSGQSYTTFSTVQEQGRTNVVYVGANDGMVHGFRAGSVNVSGVLTGVVPNDGQEVMAYLPGAVLSSAVTSAASSSGSANNCTSMNATLTQVQNIHGATPANGSAAACFQAALDYSNTQYGHNFFVDATPGSGDLFYNGTWHTWLVGGLGPGGAAIYALDVTDPTASATALTESNARAVVMGEWTPSTISCSGNSTCGNNLGQVSGSPIIRRLHNGQWGIIFGNGLNSSSGDGGIYVMVIPQTGVSAPVSPTIYYLSSGTAGNNGITSVASADLDGDGITDYVYAGDLRGNVWRFDLTSVTPGTPATPVTAGNWGVSSTTPLFKTGGPPITSQVVVAAGVAAQTVPQVMVAFGTGQKLPVTNTSSNTYGSGTQSLFGFWDWNMTAWNTLNPSAHYATLTTASEASCVSTIYLSPSNLQAQTVVINGGNGDRDIATNATVLWPTPTHCDSASRFGWSFALPGTQEQIIYNPQLIGPAFQVNSIIPAGSNLLSCNVVVDTGFSYAVSVLTGGAIPHFFQNYTNDASGTAAGIQTNATGSSAVVNTSQSANASTSTWMVYQTTSGTPSTTQINPPNNITGARVTWKQLR